MSTARWLKMSERWFRLLERSSGRLPRRDGNRVGRGIHRSPRDALKNRGKIHRRRRHRHRLSARYTRRGGACGMGCADIVIVPPWPAVRFAAAEGRAAGAVAMIVAQVALSFVLLSSGALVVRSFERLLRADPGFRPEGVFTVKVRTPPEFFPKPADAVGFQDRVQDALASISGVRGAGAASALPLTGTAVFSNIQTPITAPGAPGNTGDAERDKLIVDGIGVRSGYVETMGIRLVAGRSFSKLRQTGVAEAMIDTGVARRFFPDGNAVGSQIRFGGRPLTIVGVVGQARLYGLYWTGGRRCWCGPRTSSCVHSSMS